MKVKKAYKRGFLAGLDCFAFMKDGVYYIGTTGMTLEEAKEKVETLWNYEVYCKHDYSGGNYSLCSKCGEMIR